MERQENRIISEFVYKKLKAYDFKLEFKPLGGLSNTIYLVEVHFNNKIIFKFLFRLFGNNSKIIDRKFETEIINRLAKAERSPRVLETDYKSYRIEEFVENSSELAMENTFDDFVIRQLFDVLSYYNVVFPFKKYKIIENENNEDPIILFSENSQKNFPTNNIFDMIIKKMFPCADENFKNFSEKFEKMEDLDKKTKMLFYVNEVSDFFSSFKEKLFEIFPKEFILKVCHNDVHRLNILVCNKSNKITLIDHEYAGFNLFGTDIVNYGIEASFDYSETPEKMFNSDKFNLDDLYVLLINYLEYFKNKNNNEEEENRVELYESCYERMYQREYFLKIICLISLFWILYSLIYFDFVNIVEDCGFNHLLHIYHRIKIFKIAYKKLLSLPN